MVSAQFEIMNQSIPTQQEEQYLERGINAKFGSIKQSIPTQYEEKPTKEDEKRLPSRGSIIENEKGPEFDDIKKKLQSNLSHINPKTQSNLKGKDEDDDKLSDFI